METANSDCLSRQIRVLHPKSLNLSECTQKNEEPKLRTLDRGSETWKPIDKSPNRRRSGPMANGLRGEHDGRRMEAASCSSGKCQLTGDTMAVHAGVISGGVLQRFAAFGLVAAVGLAGCTASELPRLPQTQADLISARQADLEKSVAIGREVVLDVLTRTKAEYDAYAAGRAPAPPVMDLLILSGGGDWGRSGRHPQGLGACGGADGPPEFDAVTGVSTAH